MAWDVVWVTWLKMVYNGVFKSNPHISLCHVVKGHILYILCTTNAPITTTRWVLWLPKNNDPVIKYNANIWWAMMNNIPYGLLQCDNKGSWNAWTSAITKNTPDSVNGPMWFVWWNIWYEIYYYDVITSIIDFKRFTDPTADLPT